MPIRWRSPPQYLRALAKTDHRLGCGSRGSKGGQIRSVPTSQPGSGSFSIKQMGSRIQAQGRAGGGLMTELGP